MNTKALLVTLERIRNNAEGNGRHHITTSDIEHAMIKLEEDLQLQKDIDAAEEHKRWL